MVVKEIESVRRQEALGELLQELFPKPPFFHVVNPNYSVKCGRKPPSPNSSSCHPYSMDYSVLSFPYPLTSV